MAKEKSDAAPLLTDLEFIALPSRRITQETCRKYGYGVSLAGVAGSVVQVAPYMDDKGRIVAQKIRGPNKSFSVRGTMPTGALFGSQLIRGSGKMIVITEGEIDAMSVHQALGGTWPVVSIPFGAAQAAASIKERIDVLESYERVVLAFDKDEPGQAAAEATVELFSPGKACIADMGSYNDPNDMLRADPGLLRAAVWEAKAWRPDGVVNLADFKERISAPLEQGTPYPWAGLNRMLYGFRPQELITWTSGTGTGKTTVVSELVHHLIMMKKKVGIVYLEEGVDRAGKRIVGIHMSKPIHLPDAVYTPEEFDTAFDETLGTGCLYAYDHFGSLDEDILMNRIRYMVKGLSCEVIVLDHISMVVSGADLDSDERRMLDHVMTSMRVLTQETRATFHIVSHLKRAPGRPHEEGGKVSLAHLRGTQAIAQLSDAVIATERDQQAEDPIERNTLILRILKNRYSGLTGEACSLLFNPDTGRLEELDDAVDALPGGNDADF